MNEVLIESLRSPTTTALLVAALIVTGGVSVLRRVDKESPLAPYALQVAGLVVVIPALLVISLTLDVPTEATTGIFGTVVGYIFGAGRSAAS